MNEQNLPPDELASGFLDDELTETEAEAVRRDPELAARADALRRAADAVGETVTPPAGAEDAAVAAALADFDARRTVSLEEARRRPRGLSVITGVAATVAVGFIVAAAVGLFSDGNDDAATEAVSAPPPTAAPAEAAPADAAAPAPPPEPAPAPEYAAEEALATAESARATAEEALATATLAQATAQGNEAAVAAAEAALADAQAAADDARMEAAAAQAEADEARQAASAAQAEAAAAQTEAAAAQTEAAAAQTEAAAAQAVAEPPPPPAPEPPPPPAPEPPPPAAAEPPPPAAAEPPPPPATQVPPPPAAPGEPAEPVPQPPADGMDDMADMADMEGPLPDACVAAIGDGALELQLTAGGTRILIIRHPDGRITALDSATCSEIPPEDPTEITADPPPGDCAAAIGDGAPELQFTAGGTRILIIRHPDGRITALDSATCSEIPPDEPG